MHELVHLDFVIQARKNHLNQLFTATQSHKSIFINSIQPTTKKLKAMGVPDKSIVEYTSSIFDGMNLQIFNTPIDLFIEDFLFKEFPLLRPYQFTSLYSLIQNGLKAVTDKKILELSPREILSISKIYNIVNALQFKDLFGLDLIRDFNATPAQLKLANQFYEEYLQYKDDRVPAEEYELVQHWAEDLKLDKFFELIDEDEYRNKRTNIENLLTSIEEDPFDLESSNPRKDRLMDEFQKSQQNTEANMAVVMFMVGALQYFEDKSQEEIKKIALEIAMQGTQGFSTNKNEEYYINSIPGKKFSGNHILAYYYVSWALAIPEMLHKLNLPYDNEYKIAQNLYRPSST